jgi:hypothetical protein
MKNQDTHTRITALNIEWAEIEKDYERKGEIDVYDMVVRQREIERELEELEASLKFHIVGKVWYSSRSGYGLSCIRIYQGNEELAYLEDTNATTDNQMIEKALEWLEETGYINTREDCSRPFGGSYFLREVLGSTYHIYEVTRKKDIYTL